MQVLIAGSVATGFEPVAETFARLWEGIEVGASFCAYVDGEMVVNLWGGWLDRDLTQPWREDTLINVYSTTKGFAAAAIARLFDEGLIDYDAPVSDYWPEFAQAGKADISVAQLLSHQAGLAGVDATLGVNDLYDWPRMIALLEQQAPLWVPGTAAGYHAVTWGYFPGELVRRITGMTLGAYFRDRLAIPLAADCHIGVSEADLTRCGALIGPNHARIPGTPGESRATSPLYEKALLNPAISPFRDASSDAWRQAEIAASNGHANARGIATLYAPLANAGRFQGTEYFSAAAIAAATRPEVDGQIDLVLDQPLRRSAGFILAGRQTDGFLGHDDMTRDRAQPTLSAFGHSGAGGSIGFADPDRRVSVGYAMNQMHNDATTLPRSLALTSSLYRCLP